MRWREWRDVHRVCLLWNLVFQGLRCARRPPLLVVDQILEIAYRMQAQFECKTAAADLGRRPPSVSIRIDWRGEPALPAYAAIRSSTPLRPRTPSMNSSKMR